MRQFNITVNGVQYSVAVEEVGAASAPVAAPVAAAPVTAPVAPVAAPADAPAPAAAFVPIRAFRSPTLNETVLMLHSRHQSAAGRSVTVLLLVQVRHPPGRASHPTWLGPHQSAVLLHDKSRHTSPVDVRVLKTPRETWFLQ